MIMLYHAYVHRRTRNHMNLNYTTSSLFFSFDFVRTIYIFNWKYFHSSVELCRK